jgi:adenylate cyclase
LQVRRWFSVWVGWVRVVSIIGVFFGLIIRIGDPTPINILRNVSFDIYQQSKPRELTQLPVAILDIDDRSLEELGQWPWPRTKLADLVRGVAAAGAAAIAFDIVFSEPDRLSPNQIAADNPSLPKELANHLSQMPENDDLFAQAIATFPVILGQTTVRTAAGNRRQKSEMVVAEHALIGLDPTPFLIKFPDVVQNLPKLEANASGRGVINARPDSDGVYRRVPVVMSVQGNIRLGLTPELLRVATGGGAFAVRTNEAGIEGVVVARQLVKTAQDGTVWPYLTPSSPSRYVSASDLMSGRLPQGRLAGHLVLVGTSAIGLEDFRPTSLGELMAGVEIHAQVLENILSKTMLIRPNYTIAIELVVTLLLCLLVIALAPSISARLLISMSLLLLIGYVGASYYLFYTKRILLDPSFPVLSTFLTIMLISTVNYLREERKRREIRGAFSQYVSPDLVDQLSRNQEQLTLGGETRELTLLFSDVRGFTAIAEDFKDDPAALTLLMNKFLTILSNAIMDSHGTIDKFMGDAVMAFWNAPLDSEDHAQQACRAALRIVADIKAFNSRRLAEVRLARIKRNRRNKGQKLIEGLQSGKSAERVHKINIGIGINTGQCVVGNMGSDTRFDYTALGDPVNVASRLEGQSRYYGVQIILGSATVEQVKDTFAVIELDNVRVVGKTLPENIFTLLGDENLLKNADFQRCVALNTGMLTAYRAQDWDTVQTLLPQLSELFGQLRLNMDGYITLYQDRIEELRLNSPGPEWDGVYSFISKKT